MRSNTDEQPDVGAAPRAWRRFAESRAAVVGALFLLLLVVAAIAAEVVAPYDPTATDLRARLLPPLSPDHLLGTDDLGRDLLSRVIHSARVSLMAGAGSVLTALAIAVPLGLVAGYHGRWVEWVVMRLVDFLLSIPPLILVFVIAGILGPSLRNAIVALGVYFVPLFTRLVVGEVRSLRGGPLVEAARAVGSSDSFIIARHVLPNIASPLIVQATLSFGVAVIAEASLSFLGLGVRPPTPSWGIMLRSAFDLITREPWMVFVPATAMAATVMALNYVGDGLRAALGGVRR